MAELYKETRVTRTLADGRVKTGTLVEMEADSLFLPDLESREEIIDFFYRAGIMTKDGDLAYPYCRSV
ncbi:hypothetical protein FACS189428_7380 [Clostridia bacterium]|nr:hypothetical protein FACS189428_7380 [Clostridia bacterium]